MVLKMAPNKSFVAGPVGGYSASLQDLLRTCSCLLHLSFVLWSPGFGIGSSYSGRQQVPEHTSCGWDSPY